MKRYLFERFLKEKLVYEACQSYWQIRMDYFFRYFKLNDAKPYLNTKFGNETDFFNANPIVNYHIVSSNRAIRIIQEEPNPKDLEITAWIDEFETENLTITELVISIQLCPDTEKLAYELIKKWLVDLYPVSKMEKMIELKIELEKLDVLQDKQTLYA